LFAEDNGIGVSVSNSKGWVETNFSVSPRIQYLAADGSILLRVTTKLSRRFKPVEEERMPVLSHLKMVTHGARRSDVDGRNTSRMKK